MPAVEENGKEILRPVVKPSWQARKGNTFFQVGDVLFAKITPCNPCMQNGKHAIARNLIGGFGFGSTEFHVLRTSEQVTSDWIHSILIQPHILREAVAHFSGSVGQQRIPDSYLANLLIPLPPLDEQKRIAARLTEQLQAVAEAREATKAQLEALDALPGALLREAFAGRL